MPFSNWLHHVAVRGCLTLALTVAALSPCSAQQDNASPPQQAQRGQPDTPSPISTPTDQAKPNTDSDYYQSSCERPKSREDDDLCQQRRMAKAAEDAVWWAGFQTKLGVAGFVAVVLSLFFTGWAALAASNQVRLSRQALISTERAFVFCERILSHWVAKKETEEIIGWTFTPVLRNIGRTPTKMAINNINTWVGLDAGALPDDFDFPDYGDPSRSMIAPQAEMHGQNLHIPIDVMKKIRDGSAHAYIWGWYEYNDILPKTSRHRTEFCVEIVVTGNPIYREGGFTYRMHGAFNGFDDECYRKPGEQAPRGTY